jgi:hypothetical protein
MHLPIWHCVEPHWLLLLQAVPSGHVMPHDAHATGTVVSATIVWTTLSIPLANAHDVSIAVGALTVSVSCVPPATFAGNAVVPFVRAARLLAPSDTPTVPDGRPETCTDTVKVDDAASLPPLPLDPDESIPASMPLDDPPELPEEPPDVPLPEELPELPEPELPELLEPEPLALPPPSWLASVAVAMGW